MEKIKTKAEHTPGPWVSSEGIEKFTIGKQREPFDIAVVHRKWRDDKINTANAKLISAAPDLFEVLQMINESGIALASEIEDKMLAALDKAQGK